MEAEVELSPEEMERADDIAAVPTTVIFEAIRRDGEHELSRAVSALWWSGVAAGLGISVSVLAMGCLVAVLPDAPWSKAVASLGYTVGFLIVILGRMQLFTENTITPMLQLFIAPTRENFWLTARLWAIVFVANIVGCAISALLLVYGQIVPDAQFAGILDVSRHYAEAHAMEHLRLGIPAGFLIASLVWVLPRLDGVGEIAIIVIITYFISLGGFSHVIAGSTELFTLVFMRELSLYDAVFSGIVPTFIGNVVGGTGIFAALIYAQVREEV